MPDLLHSPDASDNDASCPRLLQAFLIDMRCGEWGPQRPSAHAVPLQRNPWRPWLRRRRDQPKVTRPVGDSDNIGISDAAPTTLPAPPAPHPQCDWSFMCEAYLTTSPNTPTGCAVLTALSTQEKLRKCLNG